MIVDIKLTSQLLGETISLFKPPFHLFGIDGIGSVDAEHFTSKINSMNGSRYLRSRVLPRDITLSMTLRSKNSGYSLHELRRMLSRICNPAIGESELSVTMKDGDIVSTYNIDVVADKYPTFIENRNLDDIQNAIINLTANQPMWKSVDKVKSTTYVQSFKFPFSKKFKMGIQSDKWLIENTGDLETPVIIEINGYALNPTIKNLTTGENIKINGEIQEHETLIIDTNPMSKKVTLHNSDTGESTDAFGMIDLSSTFFMLTLGGNNLECIAESESQGTIGRTTYNLLYSSI